MNQIYYPKAVVSCRPVLHDYGFQISQPKPFIVQPISCNVRKNSYSEADIFQVQMRFEDFPFDPRLIRSMLVSVSIFDLKKLKDQSNFDLNQVREKAIILGFVDTQSIELDASGRTISFEGRDYTSIFIETKFDNANLADAEGKRRRKIALSRPLKAIIEDLMKNVPGSGGITIEDRTNGAVTNAEAATGGGYDLVTGKKSTDGQFLYVQKNETYWDVIQSLCEEIGVICYIELDKLVLTNPRILYHGESFSSKQAVPFIYGRNISRLSFHKNLARKKRFNLVLRSWNLKTNVPVEVSIPRDATEAWARETNIERAVQKIQTLDANGAQVTKDAPGFLFPYQNKTREQLITLGEKIFEELVRQQLEGQFETREMEVNDSQGVEFDLTQLKTGTPILLEIIQEDIQYITRKTEDGQSVSDGKRIAYLIRRGYSKQTAQILVDAVAKTSGKIRPVFYLKGGEFMMASDGFTLRVDFINYIELGNLVSGKIYSG